MFVSDTNFTDTIWIFNVEKTPQEINYAYGYRTKKSMKNIDT